MKSKKNKKILIVCLSVFFAVAAITALVLFFLTAAHSYEIRNELDASNMELEIRRTATAQNTALILRKEQDFRAETEARKELSEEMIRREKREQLMLVNPWNPISEDYIPRLVSIGDEKLMDERCIVPLKNMIEDCKEAYYHNHPVPISGYRTQEYQQELFDNKIERVLASGVLPEEAVKIAAASVAVPGTSEHQLGFAIDIIDENYTDLDNGQEWTATQQWLMAHCTDYGFILRYPNGTTDITGIVYEPWHYRYVGTKTAKEITELGVTLEEYLLMKESRAEED